MDRFKTYLLLCVQLFIFGVSTAQSCYVDSASHTGFSAFDATPDLESKACELAQRVPGLKVYGYDFYPVLAYADETKGLNKLVAKALNNHSTEDQYLIIIRVYNRDDQIFSYQSYVRLPDSGEFVAYDVIQEQAISALVEQTLNESAQTMGVELSQQIEIKGLNKLLSILNGESIQDPFLLADFDTLYFEQEFEIYQGDPPAGTLPSGIYDFANLASSDGTLLRNIYNHESAPNIPGFQKPSLIITSNLSSTLKDDFDQAENIFENNPDKFIIWMHFHQTEDGVKTYKKGKNNYSVEETEALFKYFLDQAMQRYLDLLEDAEGKIGGPITAKDTKRSTDPCQGVMPEDVECQLPTVQKTIWDLIVDRESIIEKFGAYSLYCCKLPVFDPVALSVDYYNFLPPSQKSLYHADPELFLKTFEFQVGAGYGLLDGIRELMVFAAGTGYNFVKNSPFTSAFAIDMMVRMTQEGVSQGFLGRWKDTANYYLEIFKSVKEIASNFSDILGHMWESVQRAYAELTFQEGLRYAGYRYGKVLFDIVLTVLTEGGSTIGNAVKISRNVFEKVSKQGGIKAVIRKALVRSLSVDDIIARIKKKHTLSETQEAALRSDLEDSHDLKNWMNDADLVPGKFNAWDLVKHLDEGVKLNVNALGKLNNLLTSGKIPKAKLESALESHLGDILNAADDVNLGKILDRLNEAHVNEAHFDEITLRLNKYSDVKGEILNNPEQFEFFDEVLKFPENYRELAQIGDIPTSSPLYKWALGKFRKQILDNAGKLEEIVSSNIGNYVNIPDGYKTATQVHLKGAKRTVPDDFIYKTSPEIDPNTGILFNRAKIHDTKLHQDVPWTPNQYSEIVEKFEQGATYVDLELRTAVDGLNIGDNIRIFKSDVYKSIGTLDKSGTYLSTNPVF